MGQFGRRCVRQREMWTLLTTLMVTLRITTSSYLGDVCIQNEQPATISCGQDEVIRIHHTMLSAVPLVPGQPIICENPDRNNYCRAPTNRSDVEFMGRQSATYTIQSEDLNTHPERKGDCYPGVRSNLAQIFYECIPIKAGYLQSVCSDILWENEVTGFLTSPYFLSSYPSSERELDCECELRPAEGSRVELVGLLMNPSSSGLRWTLVADTGSGFNQDLSTQFYASKKLHLNSGTGTITLKFQTDGSGQQQPARPQSPVGFWLQYKAVLINNPNSQLGAQAQAGRVTLICNDPYTNAAYIAGLVAGIVIPVIIVIILIIVAVYCIRKRRRQKGESYSTDRPRVTTTPRQNNWDDDSQKEDSQRDDFHRNKAYQDTEHQPYHHNNFRQRVSADDYPEKEHQYGRSNRGRNYSNNSYNDKVFLDDVDKKSIPSSGRTGDNDSIAKKSLSSSQDSQADNYSEVNHSPKGPRHSSLGRDTAV